MRWSLAQPPGSQTIRQDNHLLILTAFLFTCLPRGPGSIVEEKRAFLRAFWGVQTGALLTYSMSGTS
jgi:hypothetical protein